MSSLKERLTELSVPKPKPSAFAVWYSGLSEDDQDAVWNSLANPAIKNYTLFPILRDEGLRVSKDTFKTVREGILEGRFKEENLHV